MSQLALPKHARVVVIGGGIIGTSVAYHLAHLGWTDVVILERDRLTSGTTWHAAGLIVTFGSTSETSTEMRKYTRDLWAKLETETGLATGFMPVGFIEVAADRDRLEEYRRVSAFNRACGVDVHEISAKQVGEMFPLARTDDILAGFYVKEDGRANPVDITMSLAAGARRLGVKIIEQVAVLDVKQARGAVKSVVTAQGEIECEFVVNCAGMWARQLGEKSGVNIPLQSAEHYYLITESIKGISRDWPVLEDPGSYGYFREEGGGLMIGLFEAKCAPWKVEGVPQDASFLELPPDWERMTPYLQKAMERVPVSQEAGIKKFFCGPESFTADLKPVVGESPEIKNYFVAAGLNSIGILTGGGLGKVMAHWIVNGRPDVDVTGMNIDRLHTYQANPEYRKIRTVESLGMVYQCHYPTKSMQTARGAKKSALHDRLVKQGAYFRDVSGWEGADWYAGLNQTVDAGPLSWNRGTWFSHWQAEHQAARNDVILMDMSFMSKFLVQGRDAGSSLNYLSGNNVDGALGRVTYTQWMNAGGTLEADLTVTKLGAEKFMVIASDTAHRHVETLMKRNIPSTAHAFVTDVTSGFAQINLQGPKSRALLQTLTNADLSNEQFPFRCAREIDLGFARVLCIRITYLGELGYELLVPTEQATHVYDRILEAGPAFGLRHAGLKALASLRMEKGYRDFGHDIDNTDSVLEAGLGFAVDFKKPQGFIGREAVLRKKESGPLKRRIGQIVLKHPEPLMFHAEVIWRNGQRCGYVRAASYGHTLGAAVGLAMFEGGEEPVDEAWILAGQFEVEIAEKHWPAVASLKPLFDPENKKVRG
jgi:glycine cleavage system aminomethyltransferase T/glycine/D-amino acid oxidase-like deaminating enzyme